MMKINTFTGLAPRMTPRKLIPSGAQKAREVRLLDGALDPLNEIAPNGSNVINGARSFYFYNGAYESWLNVLSFVLSPVTNDQYHRIYYTGDGVPKQMLTKAGTTYKRALGIPMPDTALTLGVQPKTSISWTPKWHAFWEATDGTRHSEYDFLTSDVTLVTVGSEYLLTDGGSLPPGGGAGLTLVVWFEAFSSTGLYLGSCYPKHSMSTANTDLVIDGAAVTCTQITNANNAQIDIQYNTSRQTGYNQTRTYTYTWVTDLGEESAPATPVNIDVSPVQDVSLVAPIDAPYSWVVSKRVYRSVTDSNGITQLRLCSFAGVTDIPVATTNLTDELLDEELPLDTMVTNGFDPPPATLDFLVGMPGGFLAGATGRTVYLSEPYMPYAWPYKLTVEYDVVALGVTHNSLVIVTTGALYLATGLSPDGLSLSKLPVQFPGTSKGGITQWQGKVFYTSQNGLVEVAEGMANLVTERFISREYWQSLNPATMRLFGHDNLLFVACDAVTLLFTYLDAEIYFTDTAQVFQAAQTKIAGDVFEVVLSGTTAVGEFNGGNTPRTMNWQGRDEFYPVPVKAGAYRVQASGYPLTMKLYADGAQVLSMSVTQGKAALLPSLPPAKVWSVEIDSSHTVYSVEIAPTVSGVMNG